MADINLNGLGVALVTPFHEDQTIDFGSLEKIIEYTIEEGCNYIVVLGTTAETPTLSQSEKREIASFVRNKNNGRLPLVLGLGGNCTRKVIEDFQNFDLEGYSAILSVTPYYNKPSQEGLFEHFRLIADNSPLPVILYNVPGRTGVNLSAETTVKLANYSDIIQGIKEASGNISQCEEIKAKSPSDFKLISGDDSLTAQIMKLGGSGVISVLANAMPSLMKKIVTSCEQKKYDDALEIQKKINPLISYLFRDGNPAGVKALLSKMGLCKNILR